MAKIRITETKIWEYEPDLDSDYWLEQGVTTLSGAADKDKEELNEGKITPEELADEYESVKYKVEIVK